MPKIYKYSVTCESCGHVFDVVPVEESDEKDKWETDEETASTSGDPSVNETADSTEVSPTATP